PSIGKIMDFFLLHLITYIHYLWKGKTINGEYY
ncbi:hypothetical protein EAI_02256, partial [Harpegnathos saltator]